MTFHPLTKRWSQFLPPLYLGWPLEQLRPMALMCVTSSLGFQRPGSFCSQVLVSRLPPQAEAQAGLLEDKKLPEKRPSWWSALISRQVSEANGDHPAVVRTSANGHHVNDPRRGQKNCPPLSNQHRFPPGR